MTRTEYREACNARNATIVERINAGDTYAAIAANLGLTRARIAQIAKAAGIVKRKKAA